MDSATEETLKAVRKRIANLQQIERLLLEEFGGLNSSEQVPRNPGVAPSSTANGISRKAQIHQWLRLHGPARRSEIIQGTGFPDGTVGSLLSQCPELFSNNAGNWSAK